VVTFAAGSGVTSFQTNMSGLSPQTASTGAVSLTGVLGVPNGGLNTTATSTGGIPIGISSAAYSVLGIGGANQVLTSNGTTASWQNVSVSAGVTSFSAGTTGLTPNLTTVGPVTLSGTLNTSNGGLGTSTSPTVGAIPLGSSTSAYTPLAIGTNGQVLSSNGTTATWVAPPVTTTFQTSLSGLTPSTATSGTVTLAGTLGVSSGGTGLTSAAAGTLLYGSASSPLNTLAIGTAGQILTVNSGGTAPQWSAAPVTTTFSAGTTGFTPNTPTSGAVTLAGTLAVSNGGLNATTTAVGSIPLGSSTTAYTPLAIGTNGQVLTAGATTASWVTPTPTYSPLLNKFLAATLDTAFNPSGTTTLVINTTYYSAIYLRAGTTYSTLSINIDNSGTSSTMNVGLYNSTTRLAIGTALASNTSGILTFTFTSSYTPTSSGVYWVAFCCLTGSPTPGIGAITSNYANINLTAAAGSLTLRTSSIASSALPSTISGTPGVSTNLYLVALA
jgi:hypothetical protein